MEVKKKKHQSNKRQSAQYDKIFKENIEASISSIMQNVLGITAVTMEELPDDIQHTKERKPDVLKQVTDYDGDTFVLQIEFQVKDEPEMIYRMLEYYGMLERKYKTPVKQFVIFLGSGNAKMPTLARVKETTKGDFSLKRYFNQLRILAQLRNLELNLKNAMDSIAEYIKEERDVLFLRGLDKGQEKEQEKFVRNLLTESDFTIDKIAKIAGVTTDFVSSIKKQLSDI